MVLPVHNKLQYVRHICAALSMLPQMFNLGMEWRYKTKINYPIELLAEVKHCFSYSTTLWKIINDFHTSLLAGSLQQGKIIVIHIHIP